MTKMSVPPDIYIHEPVTKSIYDPDINVMDTLYVMSLLTTGVITLTTVPVFYGDDP